MEEHDCRSIVKSLPSLSRDLSFTLETGYIDSPPIGAKILLSTRVTTSDLRSILTIKERSISLLNLSSYSRAYCWSRSLSRSRRRHPRYLEVGGKMILGNISKMGLIMAKWNPSYMWGSVC
ncbi:hypothetical protein L1049_014481 [Liquidambar formosana]|uniref:Uncharacterized protein n=1 Tax=Liquidambar formosana TaxID=63359 RepID=A0AAP0RWE2_LIQFO